MSIIIPTILTDSPAQFKQDLSNFLTLSKRIQVDFMDGDFVVAKSIDPTDIRINPVDLKIILEAHLMVEDPLEWLNRLPINFSFAYLHFEVRNLKDMWPQWVESALMKGVRLGLAINPETPVDVIKNLTPVPEALLIMGVNPGRSGQTMLEGTFLKISRARDIFLGPIGVDGGVNDQNINAVIASGADFIYIGSSISQAADFSDQWQKLNALLH